MERSVYEMFVDLCKAFSERLSDEILFAFAWDGALRLEEQIGSLSLLCMALDRSSGFLLPMSPGAGTKYEADLHRGT